MNFEVTLKITVEPGTITDPTAIKDEIGYKLCDSASMMGIGYGKLRYIVKLATIIDPDTVPYTGR